MDIVSSLYFYIKAWYENFDPEGNSFILPENPDVSRDETKLFHERPVINNIAHELFPVLDRAT